MPLSVGYARDVSDRTQSGLCEDNSYGMLRQCGCLTAGVTRIVTEIRGTAAGRCHA